MNTVRDIEGEIKRNMTLHVEDAMKKKGAKIKKAPNEVKSPETVLQALWEDLDE
jgi:hypothetical protein